MPFKGTRLAKALYFAPHFGQRIALEHPGVQVGVSYIARIERVEVLETWKDLEQAIREAVRQGWFDGHRPPLEPLRRGLGRRHTKRYCLFLSTPRLVFNPPVLKKNLMKGKGFLGKQFFSFDDLFAAWGC